MMMGESGDSSAHSGQAIDNSVGASDMAIAARRLLWGGMAIASSQFFVALSSQAQSIILDGSLGPESSRLRPAVKEGAPVELIEGGAARGPNLFHSFEAFGIGAGQRVYFANPSGIEQIFSRVTGDGISQIDGTLGVLGAADLFVLNPNGIVFGPGARLDLSGSFTASTAPAFEFTAGARFDTAASQDQQLLTVNVPLGLQFNTPPQGDLTNDADLIVDSGQSLNLLGNTLLSQGRLAAPGGTVRLLGDRVGLLGQASIDVSSETGGGNIFIGGDVQGRDTLPRARRTFVGPEVTLNADALTEGNGGQVVVWSNEQTAFFGDVSARGGQALGHGGFVEVSGKQDLTFQGNVDVGAMNGEAGLLLLDPENIRIVNGAGGQDDGEVVADSEVLFGDGSANGVFEISEQTLEGLLGDANLVLQATNDIVVEDLADGVLSFAPGSGVIQWVADGDRDGTGDVLMEDTTDTLFTNGRNLLIAGANLTLGNIDTTLLELETITTTVDLDAGGPIPLNPENTQGTESARFQFTVPTENDTVTDVDVRFSASHSWNSDLAVSLSSPDDTTLELFRAVGGAQDNFQDTVLDDEAPQPIGSGTAPFAGRFQPSGPGGLAIFNGQTSQGRWELEVTDTFPAADSGTVFVSGETAPWGIAQGTQLSITSLVEKANNGGNVELVASGSVAAQNILAFGRGEAGRGGAVEIQAGESLAVRTIDTHSRGNQGGNIGLLAGENINLGAAELQPRQIETVVDLDQGGPIPDDGTQGSANFLFSVSEDIARIDDIDVRISATHPAIDELEVSLTPPDNSLTINLFEGIETRETSLQDIILDDAASEVISSENISPQGRFKPQYNLSTYNQSSATGTWRLNFFDQESENSGTLFAAGEAAPWGTAVGTQLIVRGTSTAPVLLNATGGGNSTGGTVRLEAGGAIDLGLGKINTAAKAGAGDVLISARENIRVGDIDAASSILNFDDRGIDSGQGGKITIASVSGDITTAVLNASSSSKYSNAKRGGDILVSSVDGDVTINGDVGSSVSSDLRNFETFEGHQSQQGGDISISSQSGNVLVNGSLSSGSFSVFGDTQDGGDISISSISGNVEVNGYSIGSSSFAAEGPQAQSGGDVSISSQQGSVTVNSNIQANSSAFFGNAGDAGNISLSSQGDILANGYSARPEQNDSSFSASSTSSYGNAGNAGTISISSSSGDIQLPANLDTASSSVNYGAENGGRITLNARNGSIIGASNGATAKNRTQILSAALAINNSSTDNGGKSKAGGAVSLAANSISDLEIITLSSTGESGDVQILGSNQNLNINNLRSTNAVTLEALERVISSFRRVTLSPDDLGQSGNMLIQNEGDIKLDNVDLISNSNGNQAAGNVVLTSKGNIEFINSQISSNATALSENAGDAGTIEINAKRLLLGEGDRIFAATLGPGDGGNITVNATESVVIGEGVQDFAPIISVEARGAGRPGSIAINTPNFELAETARITATATDSATNLEGGGSITLSANRMDLAGIVGIFAETQGRSPGGVLTLQPYESSPDLDLTLAPGARISASTFASGPGGNLIIRAPDGITISGPGVLSAETSGSGPGGNIQISASRLTLADGVRISTTAKLPEPKPETIQIIDVNQGGRIPPLDSPDGFGGIDAGTAQFLFVVPTLAAPISDLDVRFSATHTRASDIEVSLTSPQGTTLMLFEEVGAGGENFQDTLLDSDAFTSISNGFSPLSGRFRPDQSGSLDIFDGETAAGVWTLDVKDFITSNTPGTGQLLTAGDAAPWGAAIGTQLLISIPVPSVVAPPRPTADNPDLGRGGTIAIKADEVNLLDGNLLAETEGLTRGGDIDIDTGLLALDKGTIAVRSTGAGNSGSISLNAQQAILLRNNSSIETDAGGSLGDGGNIDINTPFLISLPGENSDIIANAIGGDGGQVNITANNLFNFEIQDGQDRNLLRGNTTNDISASSETGTSGVITLDTLNVDPAQSLAELPSDLVDASSLIDNSLCAVGNKSEFLVTGPGGLPTSPNDTINATAPWEDWSLSELETNTAVSNDALPSTSAAESQQNYGPIAQAQPIEAKHWQRTPSGHVILYADASATVKRQSPRCRQLQQQLQSHAESTLMEASQP